MDSKDFEIDVRDFRHKIGVRRLDVSTATDYLNALVSSWNSYSSANFGGILSIRPSDEGGRLDGELLGKKFYLHYSPIGMVNEGAIEAVLTILNRLTEGQAELARFLVTPKGAIQSIDGSELVDLDHSGGDLKLLVAILNRVMDASSLR